MRAHDELRGKSATHKYSYQYCLDIVKQNPKLAVPIPSKPRAKKKSQAHKQIDALY